MTILSFLSWLDRCAEAARSRRHLAALDDRALKDIGLSRADVAAECARPFWDWHERERRGIAMGRANSLARRLRRVGH